MASPAPISHSPTLPRLSPADHALFNLFASAQLTLHALADKSGRDLAELTAWAAAEHIQTWCRAYLEVSGLRLQALRAEALNALSQTLETSNLVEKRRAATALLRALNGTPPRSVRATRVDTGTTTSARELPLHGAPSSETKLPGSPSLREGAGGWALRPDVTRSPNAPTEPTTPKPPTPSASPTIARQPLPVVTARPSAIANTTPTSTSPPPRPLPRPARSRTQPSPTALLDSLDSFRSHTIPGREPRAGIARLTATAGLAGPAP
jgi:hypothetical protein